jgi:cytoskeletal protein CcmA (bactofilin family)
MVKNIPAIERSTEIRFGKHVPDSTDQADNTIVFNASNVLVPTPYSNAVYLSPIRNRPDFTPPEVVLLMYDRNTKEITESGESANALVGGVTLALAVNRANVTSNTVQFKFSDNNTGFVTDSNVGISNLLPQHTVSVGSNLYIDEFGSNVLVVSGNVAVLRDMVIDGNLRVNGDTTVIYAENTAIKDAFIELGQNNTSEDTTLDLGVLMHRPDALSNVVIGYREGSDEFAIGYTDAKPTDKIFTPKTDEDINVHVYGLTHVDANIYVHEDLVVDGNVYVSQNVSVTEELTVSGNVYADKDLEVVGNTYVDGNVVAYKDLLVTGNVYVSQNVSVTEELTISGNVYADKDLEVVGNTYVDGNVVAYKDLLVTGNVYVSQNVSVTEELTVSGNVYADKDLEVVGNTYVSGNVVAYKDLLVTGNVYVSTNASITEELTVSGNVYADKDLEVVGNTYVDGNVVAYKDLLVTGNVYVSQNVSVTEELTVSGNVYADKDLEVVGNTYVSGNVEVTKALIVSANTHLKGDNVFITHTMDFLDPTTAIVTDQVSNVQIRLGQLENVSNAASNPLNDQVLLYDGGEWTNLYPNHSFLKIKNDSLSTMVSGNAVYVSGYQNENLAKVKLAKADSPTTMPSIGIVYSTSIPPGEEGLAAAYGKVNQMNTNGYNVGETLYVSNTYAGWISNVKPYYTDSVPNLIQNIGVVTRKDTSHGAMFVTGIGRANDVPNATVKTSNASVNYVYVNSINNDFLKIDPMKLPTKLQPLTHVVNTGNTAANAVTLRGVSITSGDGFHGDLVVAGNVTVDTNTLKVDAEANRVGILTVSPGYPLDVRGAANVGTFTTTTGTVTDGTHSTSRDTGVLVLTQGGLGVEANIHSTNVFATSHIAVGTSATSNTFDVRGTANVGALVTTSTHISDSTAVTSKTTGALQVTGGVGIQGDIHATHANLEDVEADSVTVTDATAATSVTSGALQVVGGVGIQGDLHATNGVFTTNVYITNHTDLNNKHLAMIDTNGSLIQSPVYVAPSGKYVISAAEAEFLGNITLGGNTTLLTSTSLIVEDRIIGIGSNNSAEGLDSGIIIEHQDEGTFANVALIHHADEHRFSIGYTQNTLTDNHILNASHPDNVILRVDLIGNTIVQNSLSVSEMGTFGTKVGISTTEPIANIHVVGNAFVTSNITTSSNVLITGDAAATSKTTGALQVAGGVGISGDIHATHANLEDVEADSVTVTDTTTSTSITTGALKVAGGMSTQEKLNVGGITKVWDSTVVTSKTDGALVVVGGVGISGDIHATHANLEDVEADSVTVTDTTTSTSITTGALKVAGGVSTQEKLNVGGITKVWDSTAVTSKTDGALVVVGGVGISGDIHATHANLEDVEADSVTVTDTTTSTSITTGALKVAGGVSTQEKLNVGGVTKIWDSTAVTSKTDGALVVVGGVGISGDIHATHANLEDVEADSVTVTDTTVATNKTSGALQVAGGVGVSGALYGAAATFDGVTSVTNATAVTSKTDGALVVTGGVGISGDIHATHANLEDVEADSVTVTDATQATDTLTGALTVAGGLSTQTNVHAANVYISGGLITNTAGVTKKTYAYSGTIGDTEQPHINVCFTNQSFNAKIDAQLIEGDDEISTISFVCCGGNKGGTFPASDIQVGSVQVFGPASTNPWSSAIVTDKTTVALKPSGAIDTSGEYHIFVEYTTAKSAGAVANVVQDATEQIVFGY